MQFTAFSFVDPCGYPPDSPDHSIIREAFVEALMSMPREQAVAVLGNSSEIVRPWHRASLQCLTEKLFCFWSAKSCGTKSEMNTMNTMNTVNETYEIYEIYEMLLIYYLCI